MGSLGQEIFPRFRQEDLEGSLFRLFGVADGAGEG